MQVQKCNSGIKWCGDFWVSAKRGQQNKTSGKKLVWEDPQTLGGGGIPVQVQKGHSRVKMLRVF